MHELAIAQGVVDVVLERTGDRPVSTVRLRVGRLAGVVPDSLLFCFDLVTAGTPAEGAVLQIEDLPGRARCRACHTEFVPEDLFLLCPCGSADIELLAGQELLVASVDLG